MAKVLTEKRSILMEYIQSFLIVILEIICFFLFQDAFVLSKKKYSNVVHVLWILAVSAMAFAMSYCFENSFLLKEISMITIFFVATLILKGNQKKQVLLMSVMFIFLLVIADIITILIDARVLGTDKKDVELEGMLIVLMSKAILLILILIIRSYVRKRWKEFQKQDNELKYAVIPFVSICLMAVILTNDMGALNANGKYIIWSSLFCLLLVNLILVMFMKSDAEKNQLLQERRMFEVEARGEQKYYKSIEEKLDMQKRLSHDYKNHLNCIQSLIEHQNYDEVKTYLGKLNQSFDRDVERVDTHNVMVNTVLNTKYNEAKELGAAVALQVGDLSDVNMDEMDIILLLSNLFNNAIEALETCEKDKVLRIKLEMEQGQFLISIQNSYSGKRRENGELFETTKEENKEMHGYGLKNIIRVVDKYEGVYQFDAFDTEFHAVIMIPMKKSQ